MRAYQDMVFSTAARLVGDDRQAEDIAQEVFLKAYENFGHLQTSPSAGGWLKTVARNLSLNHVFRYRKRWRMFSELRREDSDENEPDVEFALPDDVLAGVDADVRHGLIEDAMQTPAGTASRCRSCSIISKSCRTRRSPNSSASRSRRSRPISFVPARRSRSCSRNAA